MSGVKLRGCGHCVPARVVTNDDLAKRMDTSDAADAFLATSATVLFMPSMACAICVTRPACSTAPCSDS